MASPLQLIHEAMVMQESGERVVVVCKQLLGGTDSGLALSSFWAGAGSLILTANRPGGFLSVEKKAPNWDKGPLTGPLQGLPTLGRAEPLQPSLDAELRGPAGLSLLLILSQVKWCLLVPSALLSPTLTTGTLTSHLR